MIQHTQTGCDYGWVGIFSSKGFRYFVVNILQHHARGGGGIFFFNLQTELMVNIYGFSVINHTLFFGIRYSNTLSYATFSQSMPTRVEVTEMWPIRLSVSHFR